MEDPEGLTVLFPSKHKVNIGTKINTLIVKILYNLIINKLLLE